MNGRYPTEYPPPWAIVWGDDRFGLWAEFRIGEVVQRMRWIEPGEFLMGSPEDEAERYGDESPQHPVRLSVGFWLADSACSQELWLAVMEGENPSSFQDDYRCPVERVNWNDVHEFLQALQDRLPSGANPMLLTEAQWEYACRAGTETPFSFGENITPEQVNYDGEFPYDNSAKGENRKRTLPVRHFPPNDWGLYEMHGNVREWCADGMRDYEALPGDKLIVDPEGPIDPNTRVLRGGSWFSFARGARSASRYANRMDGREIDFGFRLALTSTSAGQARPEDFE